MSSNTKLDIKRLNVQLAQVSAARLAMELSIEERLDEIERLKSSIQIQLDKETEISAAIKKAASEQ